MITGTIKKIIYSNEDFVVAIAGGVKISGKLPGAVKGLKVTVWGEFKEHPEYGKQYAFTRYKLHIDDPYPYLSSGLIKGIKNTLAKKIIESFPDPVSVILNDPGKLSTINGISNKKAFEISRSVKETIKYKQTAMDLAPCELSPGTLIKVHHQIKKPEKVLENPYILTEVEGIGFIKADNVAQKLGISLDSPQRIQAALNYELKQSVEKEGHVYLPEEELAIRTFNLLNEKISPALIEENIKQLGHPRDGPNIYLPNLLEAENGILNFFQSYKPPESINVEELLNNYDIELSASQKESVRMAFKQGIIIITGGPGTGKTETVRAITSIHKNKVSDRIVLAAPTGRASQRMAEVTGLKAQTIHRLIGPEKIINADLIIIDETSMVDIELFYKLLKHVSPGTRLVFVGDPDQLPPVGPGQVLKDLSGVIPTVKLTQVFRQAEESNIIVNAHRINSGDMDLKNGTDFFFVKKETPEEIREVILNYAMKFMNKRHSLEGLQILSLMKKGSLGTDELNVSIQKLINNKHGRFNIADRVIQLVNNYSKRVFNGEIGTVTSVNPFKVKFEHEVHYDLHELDQVSLAYAITVHKSQGSEFPVVLIPLHTQHYIMLNKKILYTAVTRAKKMVILVGSFRALSLAVGNELMVERNSNLREKLQKKDIFIGGKISKYIA